MSVEEIRDLLIHAKRLGLLNDPIKPSEMLFSEPSKRAEFLRLVSNDSRLTEQEIITKLYGSPTVTHSYETLKSKALSLLLDLFLNSDIKDHIDSEATKGIFDTRKYQLLAALMERLGAQKQAISLARRALKLSRQFQLSSVTIDVLEVLRRNASLEGNQKLFKAYTTELENASALLVDEIRIRSLDYRIRLLFSRGAGPKFSLKKLFPNVLEETNRMAKSHPNHFIIQTYTDRVHYMVNQWDGNIEQSLIACQKAIAFLSENPLFAGNIRFGEFLIYELENYLLLRDYEQGIQTAIKCNQYIGTGTNTWFQYKEYHFRLAIQTENFSAAAEILSEVTSHRRFELQIPHQKERWHIYALYVEYIQWVEKRNAGDSTTLSLLRHKKYRDIAYRFPNYRRDKQGFNIAIILLNILILIESHKYDSIVEQIESLDSYRIRYLRNSRTNQTAVLFRMLRVMVTQEFDPKAIQRRTKHLLPLLSVIRQSPHEMTEGLQILSPLWIWNRILTVLENKS